MKLALARYDGRRAAGIVDTDRGTWTLVDGAHNLGPTGLAELISEPPPAGTTTVVALDGVELLPPIPRPSRNVMCVGKNYIDHAEEFDRSGYNATATSGSSQPIAPIFFTKAPSSVIGPGADISANGALTRER